MKILMTGAAGDVGRILIQRLRGRHAVRGFDLEKMPDLDDAQVGDLADLDAVKAATGGVEAVIHLGGIAGSSGSWEQILSSNVIGTYNVFEAARESGVRRVAFASRAGLLRSYPEDVQRTVDMYPRPNSYYSISKTFGEQLGCMYAEKYGMEVVCVRIGNLNVDRDQPEHPHHLSHNDAAQVFERAVTQPGVGFEIVFGVSDSNWPLYDLDHGRKVIGYEPENFANVSEDQRGL